MGRQISPTIAAAVAVITTLCLTGCTPPLPSAAAAPAITPSPLKAPPSSAPTNLVLSGPPPTLTNTGTNWAATLASLLTYGQWLLANPGAGAATTVAAPGCPLTDLLTTRIAGLSSATWRLAPAPLTISSLNVPSALAAGQTKVILQLVASRGLENIVDSNGQPASAVAALPPTAFDVSLGLGGDAKWRLCAIQPAQPALFGNGALQTDPSLL